MLANLTIRIRLALLVIAPLLVLLAVIMIASINTQRINENMEHLFVDRMTPISQLKTVSDSYAVSMVDTLHKYRAGLVDEARLQRDFDKALQQGNKAWDEYRATKLTESERALVNEVDGALRIVRTVSEGFVRSVADGSRARDEHGDSGSREQCVGDRS